MGLNPNSKNIISLFLVELLSRLIGFAAVTYLARILGTNGFGVINIGLAVLSYLLVLASSGLTLSGTKKLLEGSEDSGLLPGNVILTRFTFSMITLLGFVLAISFFVNNKETYNVLLIYSLYLFPSAFLLEWYFHGRQRMDIISIGRTVGMLSYLAALLLIVHHSTDTMLVAVAWVLGGITNALYLFLIFWRNNFSLEFKFHLSSIIKLIKESLSLSAASIITQFVIQFPVIYAGIALSNSDAGIYSAAYKLIVLILVVDRVFNALFFPKIVNFIKNRSENIDEMFNMIYKIISFVGITILFLSMILAETAIKLLFGSAFTNAATVFIILLGAFYFTLLSSIFTYTLIAMNCEKQYVYSLFIGAVVFFVSIVLLTGYFGVNGIAASYVLFELVSFIIMNVFISKKIKTHVVRTVILPAIIIVLSKMILYSFTAISLQLLLAVAFCLPMILYTVGIGKEEFRFIKRIFI